MAAQQQKSGKPWSGTNRIPNIKEFVAGLDREKSARDKEIDAKASSQQANYSTEVTPHKNEKAKKTGKSVTDPVTGNEVVIDDVGKEYLQRADNPQVGSIASVQSPELAPLTPV
jgi:hypothetical protein